MHAARLIAPLAVLAAAAHAADDVDLQVRGNEKIDGTLRPADQRERFLVDAPRGAVLTVTAKRKGTGGPVPSFEILDGMGAVVVQGEASPTGAKLTKYVLANSDLYRVRVFGDDTLDGDYQLKVKLAPAGSWQTTGVAPLAAGATVDYTFGAAAGSAADIGFSQTRSEIAPRIVSIDGPDGFHRDFDDAGLTPTRHRVAGVVLGGTGDYTVHLRNDGAVSGAWGCQVRLSAAKVGRTNVDIRDTALTGAFGGSNAVFGRVVDPGGALVDPPDTGGPLDGSSVQVPAGALGTPTVIALASSDTFFVDDTNHAAGIAVSLTPSGTTFSSPVTVTVPFDPQSFDNPETELSIYVQNAETGELEAVPRDQLHIDTVLSTVSFPTSHFSRFQGTSPKPRPVKGEFIQLEIGGRALPGFGGQIVFGLTRFRAFQGKRSGNGFQRVFGRRSISFGPAGLSTAAVQLDDFGILTIDEDQLVTMQSGTEGNLRLVRGRNPDVLIQPPSANDPSASASIVLRVANANPTPATVAGFWTASVLEFVASKDASGAVVLTTTGQNLTLQFALDGSVTAKRASTATASPGADPGTWAPGFSKAAPPPGTFTIRDSGIDLAMALGTSPLIPDVLLTPTLGGNVLIGVASGIEGSQPTPTSVAMRLVVLVHTSRNPGAGILAGPALFSRFGVIPVERPGGTQDVRFFGDDAIVTHDGVRGVSGMGARFSMGHDMTGGVLRAPNDLTQMTTYLVAKDGTYRELEPPSLGVVAPRGGLYAVTRYVGTEFSFGFGVVAAPK